MHYVFCPICGTKLEEKTAGDEGKVPYCQKCEKYWFDTFSDCVIILLANEHNEIAMLKQSYMSDRYWTYVSGFMKPGETAEETALREVDEELGLNIDRLEYAGTYWFGEHEELMHGFIGFTRKKNFVLSKEVDEALWIPFEKAPCLMFPPKKGNCQQPIYSRFMEMIKAK